MYWSTPVAGPIGFNGKRKDSDIGEDDYDYGMRISDQRIARFLSIDPLQKKYPELTPYQFAGNRPIDGVDLDGLEWKYYEYKVCKDAKGAAHVTITKTKEHYTFGLSDRYFLQPAGSGEESYDYGGIAFDTYQEMWAAAAKFGFGQADFDVNYKAYDDARWRTFKMVMASEIANTTINAADAYVNNKVNAKANAPVAPVEPEATETPANTTNKQAAAANNGNPAAAEANTIVSQNRGRGVAYEKANSSAAQAYENTALGAASDVASKNRIVPTLKFDNPNPRGLDYIKFDGFEEGTSTFIDRKLNVTGYPKSIDQISRAAEALSQNPTFNLRYEVPANR